MLKKNQKRSKRFKLKKQNKNKSNVYYIKWGLLFVIVVSALSLTFQTYRSLKVVVNQFSKTSQWDLSSQVYSNPTVVYPGQQFKKNYIQTYLNLLAYKRVKRNKDLSTASYVEDRQNNALNVFFHAPKEKITFYFDEHHFLNKIIHHDQGKTIEKSDFTLPPTLISEFYGDKREKRTVLTFSQFPQTLKTSIVLMEDRRFYTHHGVSVKGILRAVLTNLTRKSYAQGGSTLTQQLMKNFFLSHEKTLKRKWKELILALIVEKMYSKEKIFELYLNEIYLGQAGNVSIHGFEEAAQFYFREGIKDCSIAQQAMLVGLLSSPGRYSPFYHLQSSVQRRNVVLKHLFDHKEITQKEYGQAVSETVHLAKQQESFNQSYYFRDSILRELNENFTSLELNQQGYQIHTSIDPVFQSTLEKKSEYIFKELLKTNKDVQDHLQLGAISIHPKSGAIKAIVASGMQESQYNHVYQMKRPVGSIIKPLILSYMMDKYKNDKEKMISNTIMLEDSPRTIKYGDKVWTPKNYANEYFGKVSLRTVIEKSLNSGFINLLEHYSFKDVYDMLKSYGFTSFEKVPSMSLGVVESNPYEMSSLFSMLVNSGVSVKPKMVYKVDRQDVSIQSRQLKSKKLISPEVAYQVLYLMQGVINNGTAKSSKQYQLKHQYAGKTGTTNSHKDAWFVGISENLVTVIWFGMDENTKTQLTGANSSLQLWLSYTKALEDYIAPEAFFVPDDMVFKKIDKDKGCRWGLFKNRLNNFEEVFLKQYEVRKCSHEN